MRQRGFSLIEIVVTIAVLALMLFAALPSLGTWLDNARIRNVADSLSDVLKPRGLRKWLSFRRQRSYDTGELEYRTWPTATVSDARRVVGLIRDRHQAVMRKYSSARA